MATLIIFPRGSRLMKKCEGCPHGKQLYYKTPGTIIYRCTGNPRLCLQQQEALLVCK